MSALAIHSFNSGLEVCGSDKAVKKTDNLKDFPIKIYSGKSAKNIKKFSPDLVVYTSAISSNSPELKFARKQGLKILKRSEYLGLILKGFNKSVAVCGCHGKTTTTAMLSHVIKESDLEFTTFIGGEDSALGNYYSNGNKLAVCEACEFKKNFLDLSPTHAIVLNIDDDHQDSFVDMQDRINCFKKFISNSLSVVNADDENAKKTIGNTSVTYGINSKCAYKAKNVKQNKFLGVSFTLYFNDNRLGRINLREGGVHNVYNALSVSAISLNLGVPFTSIKKGLEGFEGVSRRMQNLTDLLSPSEKVKTRVQIIADYAHHPTEIKRLIEQVRAGNSDHFVFQPHTYSRTRELMDKFVDVLSDVENLYIYKTYPAREKRDKKGDAKALYKALKKKRASLKVKYVKNDRRLKAVFNSVKEGRIFVVGAGDLYDKVKKYLNLNNI